jgi:hypothetical protein
MEVVTVMLTSVNTAYNSYGKLLNVRCRRCKNWFVQLDPHQKYCIRVDCLRGRQLEGLHKSREKAKRNKEVVA